MHGLLILMVQNMTLKQFLTDASHVLAEGQENTWQLRITSHAVEAAAAIVRYSILVDERSRSA